MLDPFAGRAVGAAREHHGLYAGPRSSALVGGYTQQHRELEAALAELKGVQRRPTKLHSNW